MLLEENTCTLLTFVQVDIRPDALQTIWMCALCHQRSAQDELGDLFGPYYVNMRPEGQWPSFLFRKSLKVTLRQSFQNLLYGTCLLKGSICQNVRLWVSAQGEKTLSVFTEVQWTQIIVIYLRRYSSNNVEPICLARNHRIRPRPGYACTIIFSEVHGAWLAVEDSFFLVHACEFAQLVHNNERNTLRLSHHRRDSNSCSDEHMVAHHDLVPENIPLSFWFRIRKYTKFECVWTLWMLIYISWT